MDEALQAISVHGLIPFFVSFTTMTSLISTLMIVLIGFWTWRLEKNTNSKMDAVLRLATELAELRGNMAGQTKELEKTAAEQGYREGRRDQLAESEARLVGDGG